MRVAFLAAVAMPFLRSRTSACSISPLASESAFLQSIMGAPLRSRSSFTWTAETLLVVLVLIENPFLHEVFLHECGAATEKRPTPRGNPFDVTGFKPDKTGFFTVQDFESWR